MSVHDTALQQKRTTPEQMRALVERHMAAEAKGDVAGALSVYTEDVVHDSVGAPAGPARGKEQAAAFYEMLTSNTRIVEARVLDEQFALDAYVVEHEMTITVQGEFMGVPGHGKQATFRMLHVFKFRDGLISHEQVWLDGGSIVAQLTV